MSRAVITVTIPNELVEKLDARAESEYRSRSSLATQLIAQGLEYEPLKARREEVHA